MRTTRLAALFALGVAIVSPRADAQAAACAIELGKPGQVKDANSALAKASLFAGKTEQISAAVKEAVTKLQKDEAKVIAANKAGHAMVLGNAFVEAAGLPNGMAPVSRASLGLTTDPTGMIDLVAAADSMFDIVESLQPACKDETEGPRRKIYAALVNDAVNQYNGQNVDTALALANRGLSIYDGNRLAYIAYNIKGNALQAKDDMDGAVASFRKMTDLMKGDTALVNDRKSTMINIAALQMSVAESLDEEKKKAKVGEAIASLQQYLQEFPGDPKAEAALARAQIMSGDAGAAERVFGAMAANPDKYTDFQLFEAGVNAARAEKAKEAAALFEAGLKKNPYSRDALFNHALTLQKLEKWNDAEAAMRRLVQIDPENPEVYQVFALNYQGLAKPAKEAAAKKPATSPEAKHFAAVNDSLLKYFTRFQEAKHKVAFTLWSHDGAKHTLAGTVENLGDAERSYTVKFEFMDAGGKVIASQDAVVGAVGAKSSKPFRLEVQGEGIVAFKYAPFQ